MFRIKKYLLSSYTLAFLFFLLAAIYITYPLIFHLSDYADGEFVIAWILNWDIHSILTGNLSHLFQANIYYPYTNTLAYSDLLLSSSIITIIPFLISHNPMVPSNVTFLSSLILIGFFTYLLSYYLTKNFWASLLAGCLVVFSPATLDKRVHLQILTLEWIPLAILFFLMFGKTGKFRYFIFSLLFFVIQTYNSFMAGYFIVFSYIILSLFLLRKDKKLRARFLQRKIITALLIAIASIVPICIPYFQVSHEFNYTRDIRDTIHFALQPEDFLVTLDYSRLYPFLTIFSRPGEYPANAEIKPGFPGLVFFILSIVTFMYVIRLKRKNILLVSFISIALLGLILSLGPFLHINRQTIHHPFPIPLPYAIFYYLAPGFQGFRNSARFEMLFIMTMPVAIALMLSTLLKKQKQIYIFSLYALLFVCTIGEFNFPIPDQHARTFAQFPPVYSWIATHTPMNAVLLEMPIYNWDNFAFVDNPEVTREYYSTIHFRNLIGGGSGFSPPAWQSMAIDMYGHFPSKDTVAEVKKLGATYLIVHADEYTLLHNRHWVYRGYTVPDGAHVIEALNKYSQLKLVYLVQNTYVYTVN